jgi:AI-2 transport protein TqsA
MIIERRENPGAHFLQVAAAVVIVVGGLKLGQPVLLPFALALLLAIMSLPLMFWMQMRQVPVSVSILLTVLVTVGVFGLIILLASQSVAELQPQLPRYSASLTRLFDSWLERAGASFQVDLRAYFAPGLFDAGRVFDFLGGTATRIAGFLSSAFLVFLILAFMLGEATVFPFKVRAILGRRAGDGRRMTKIIREVQEYLVIKTVVSLATGLLIGLWAWLLDLDFPVLLGLAGFVLNYIPTVGSILAAIPALLLSLVLVGTWMHAALVAFGYLVVNTIFGNIIEPQLMGRRLGLSTLVVILSLLFWAWLWGPVGAILSVPLTMAVKIMLENTEDLRWAAVLLDKSPPQARIYRDREEQPSTVVEELSAEAEAEAEDIPDGHAPEVA